MPKGEKFIVNRRCDASMRRSKEKCYTPYHTDWRCTGECSNCICCIYKTNEGTEHHVNLMGVMPKDSIGL